MPAVEQAPLQSVLIDDVTWGCATRLRRAEWVGAINDLVEDARFQVADAAALRGYVTVHKDSIELLLHDPAGRVVEQVAWGQMLLRPLFKEYMSIVQDMVRGTRGVNSPQLEALDIAKRLTHDDAAETLQRAFRVAAPDHQTARRLFTLLVVLTHDTTRLDGVLTGN